MSAARRVAHAAETIRARWERGVAVDPQTEAAQALEDAGQLLDPEVADELVRLRARVAELLAERHSTNEAPDGKYPPALPWAALMDDEDLQEFLGDLLDSLNSNPPSTRAVLAEVEKTCSTWRLVAEAQHAHNTAPGPDAVTRTFLPVASLREPDGAEVPCSRCGDPVHWAKSSNSDGGFWRHSHVPGRVLDHFGEVAGAEGRHAFEKEYQGVSDAKRRLANCKHCGQSRSAPMHPEPEGEFHGALHHGYRVSHDLPETGGAPC